MASKSEEKDARVKGMVEKLKSPAGKFRSMNIDAADNGYSVRTHRDMPPKKKGEKEEGQDTVAPSTYDEGSHNTVHSSLEDVIEHVRKHLSK